MKTFFAVSVMLALLVPALALAAGKVAEAKLGKHTRGRSLVADETSVFAAGEKAYLWRKIDDAAGEPIIVTCQTNGQTYPAELKIGGSPWRTWASNTLHIVGEWTATVTDAAGATLNETRFTVK